MTRCAESAPLVSIVGGGVGAGGLGGTSEPNGGGPGLGELSAESGDGVVTTSIGGVGAGVGSGVGTGVGVGDASGEGEGVGVPDESGAGVGDGVGVDDWSWEALSWEGAGVGELELLLSSEVAGVGELPGGAGVGSGLTHFVLLSFSGAGVGAGVGGSVMAMVGAAVVSELGGQPVFCSLHSVSSVPQPVQGCPPYCSSSFGRARRFTPTPQLTEQLLQGPQSSQWQSTGQGCALHSL